MEPISGCNAINKPGVPRIRKPIGKNHKRAKQILKVKEIQLIQGNFDSYDLEKMRGFFPEEKKKEEVNEEVTEAEKKPVEEVAKVEEKVAEPVVEEAKEEPNNIDEEEFCDLPGN